MDLSIQTPSGSQPRLGDNRGSMEDPEVSFAQAIGAESDPLSVKHLLLAFRRNRWLVLGIALATIAGAAIYTRMAKPVYRGSATIRIENKDSERSPLAEAVALPGMNGGQIQTEMEVLKSRQLVEDVAKALNLNLEVSGPSTARLAIRVVNLPADVPESEVVLTKRANGTYAIRQEGDAARVTLPASVETGKPFSVGKAVLVLDGPEVGRLPAQLNLRVRPLRQVVDEVRKKLVVTRPSREAQIVNVSYESNNRFTAAAVPNLLLDQFMLYKAQTTKSEATVTVAFLRDQVGSYDRQLKDAEAALGGYREEAKVVSIADEAQAQVKRMAELHAERDQVESERRSLANVLAKPAAPGASVARDIAAFPSFITNRGMQDILQSLIQLENERSQLLIRRNPENADVVALSQRISDLDRQLNQMARAYLGGLDSKLASLNKTIRSFGAEVEKIPSREIAFARLSREQKLLGDISTLLQTRLKEAEIKEAVQPGGVRVIDEALVPDLPISPKPVLNILLGTLLGLFLGGGIAVAKVALDTKVRTREDVQSVTGGIPILAAIPLMSQKGRSVLNGTDQGVTPAALAPSTTVPGTALIAQHDARDVFAESYRGLRTNILFVPADHPNQVLLITSALPGDGKSTTAANLALTLARRGTRTLLVDADLRKGVLHDMMGVPREPGLTQVLVGKSPLNASLQTVQVDPDGHVLYLLASGRLPANPAELLGSVQMLNLLEELRQQFDMIVFDTPPLNFVSDAAVLATLADATILVARAGITDKRALYHASAQLHHLRVQVTGTVVNGFDPGQSGYGYDYGYGYAPGYEYASSHVK